MLQTPVIARCTNFTNFLLTDGSIHPIKATISPTIYQALATINGKEVVNQGAY